MELPQEVLQSKVQTVWLHMSIVLMADLTRLPVHSDPCQPELIL